MRSKKAFTFAEIMIAATIVAILSAMAVFAVGILSQKAVAESLKTKITSEISSLDRSVRDRSVWSYRATFSTGSIGYVSFTDTVTTSSWSIVSYDWGAASGVFRVQSAYSWPWAIRLAQDNKIIGTVSLVSASATVPFSFETGKKDTYSAAFFFDSEPVNRITFVHFDRESVLAAEESQLTLRSIFALGAERSSLVIENALDSKSLFADGIPIDSATLTFVKGAKEYSVEIRK